MAILTTIGYVILAICVLLVMVLIHEFGHYCIGRWLGFKITEFSIGFGKAIFSKVNKRGEKISLRIFPLGGYCAFAGEGDDDEPENDKKPNDKEEKNDETVSLTESNRKYKKKKKNRRQKRKKYNKK